MGFAASLEVLGSLSPSPLHQAVESHYRDRDGDRNRVEKHFPQKFPCLSE
jgi:hypothetical protein